MPIKKKTAKPSKPAAKAAKPAKAPAKKAAPAKAAKAAKPVKAAKAVPAPAAKKLSPKETEAVKRKAQAKAAMEAALQEETGDAGEEDEFDPEAFFAASEAQGEFRAHIMRKERVEFNLSVRVRNLKSPLVTNAELLNLSKGGLCVKCTQKFKDKTLLRIEIPLPHTSELFAVQAEVIWSEFTPESENEKPRPTHTGMRFMQMSLAKQTVINTFIQQRRDHLIMAKIGLDNFNDSAPVAGVD